MSKFKVGDRVRLAGAIERIEIPSSNLGSIGEIVEDSDPKDEYRFRVKFDNGKRWYAGEEYLEHVEELAATEPKFKVGDRVRLVGNVEGVYLPDNQKGLVGVIVDDRHPDGNPFDGNSNYRFLVEFDDGDKWIPADAAFLEHVDELAVGDQVRIESGVRSSLDGATGIVDAYGVDKDGYNWLKDEAVGHPKGIHRIVVIEEAPTGLLFAALDHLWQACWESKGQDLQDLKTAREYLDREIARRLL